MRITNFRYWLAAISLIVPSMVFAMDDTVINQAQVLISSGEYQAAYKLLEPFETERAGDADYDYLLGVAGVESGNVTRGVFALERVLATQPNNSAARTEMAKAHFRLGEIEASKTEFQNLLNQKPAQDVINAIERYITAIDKSQGLTTTFGAFLDFGIGYDSNVNSANSAGSVAVPAFGGTIFNLASSGREQSDNFVNLSGGLSVRHPLSKDVSAFGSVTGSSKINGSQTIFDTSSLDFNAGLQIRKFIDVVTISAQDGHFDVDSENYRHAYGLTAQWQRNFDDRNQGNLYAQATRLEYAGSEIRNADRFVIGGGWAHVFAGDKLPVMFSSIYAGNENARDSQADFLDNHLWGLRVGGKVSLTTKLIAYASTGYEHRGFQGKDPEFLVYKVDNQYDATVGLRYLPARDWTIKPELSYLKNNSNIVINDFDRYVLSVNARKDFNW